MARSVTDQTLATSRFSAPGIAVWKSYVGGQKGAEHQLNGIERWSTKPEAAGSNPAGRVPITKRNPAPKAEYRGIDRRGSRTAQDRSDSLEGSSLHAIAARPRSAGFRGMKLHPEGSRPSPDLRSADRDR